MNLRPLLIIPPIILGFIGFKMMTQQDQTLPPPPAESHLAVRVSAVVPHEVSATAVGYGRAEPVRDWSAISEVQGRIVMLADGLAVGSFVDAGTVLAEIDRTDYELSRQKSLANIAAAEAQLAELERQEVNSRASLEVEQRILAVAQAEYDRIASLVGRGTSTQATLDSTQKVLLAQTNAVTKLENTLALYPSQRETLEATLAVRRAELAEAERSLEKATILAPFRGRISAMNVETGQFVRTGDTLLTMDDTAAVEITAEVQPSEFVPMVTVALGDRFTSDTVVDVTKAIEIFTEAGITAQVSMQIAGISAHWPAEIVRLRGTMDSETGTLGIVVRVKDPMVSQRQINRPPLNVGAFVTVTFSSQPHPDGLTVPRRALRYADDGAPFVYVADGESRLDTRKIETGQVIGENVMVLGGLEGGEMLVLTDPRPPVIGMKLDLVPVEGDSPAEGE
ncbi:efflux RND transporter periplasmic adaptor subunit [Aliiruegeria lutimaris]|uniref:RND family efflux transporter, MFP subunit n=1 Tax=Aliiruegeria lutimaris TaxID=571298 RepID=A0A1G8KSG9_9RHOB|nr:efflux RND transporter periplasmic adaptor subunit [Aliiruegeria lutimaris]SDI46384.1 RND family efflux transporter, MFP subunit [Aliiruegeria lutimaris]